MEALPEALAQRGVHVMSVAPGYAGYPGIVDAGVSIPLSHPALPPQAPALPPPFRTKPGAVDCSPPPVHVSATPGRQHDRHSAQTSAVPQSGDTTAGTVDLEGSPERKYLPAARLRAAAIKGVLRVFVDHPLYSGTDGHNIYSTYTAAGAHGLGAHFKP